MHERRNQLAPKITWLGEFFTRPDGIVIIPYGIETKGNTQYRFKIEGFGVQTYTKDEVLLLGEGNLDQGLVRIGRSMYDAPIAQFGIEKDRLLNKEIEQDR